MGYDSAGTLRSVFLSVAVSLFLASPAGALNIGQPAPDFTLPAPGHQSLKLADLLGKGRVVIYTFIQASSAP